MNLVVLQHPKLHDLEQYPMPLNLPCKNVIMRASLVVGEMRGTPSGSAVYEVSSAIRSASGA